MSRLIGFFLFLLIRGLISDANAAAPESLVSPVDAKKTQDCMKCHADPKIKGSLGRYTYIDPALFSETTHAIKGCVSCHTASEKHPDDGLRVSRVKCDSCHESAVKEYLASAHFDHASCTNCHNPHNAKSLAVVTSTQMNGQCTNCHKPDKVYVRHSSWLPQTVSHLEKLPCISCHSDTKEFVIAMYVEKRAANGNYEPMTQKEMAVVVRDGQMISRIVDDNGDEKISLAELRRFNFDSRPSGIRLQSMVLPKKVSHRIQVFKSRFDCISCHGSAPDSKQSAFVLFPDSRGERWTRMTVEEGAALDVLYGTPDFYMVGASATRSPWMSAIGLLIVSGGGGAAGLHLFFRVRTRSRRLKLHTTENAHKKGPEKHESHNNHEGESQS